MAAAKGNKYALGHHFGRPLVYETAEAMHMKISEYFQYCIDNKEKTTITGLALYLGFSTIQSLFNYEERGQDFLDVIKRARLVVANGYEQQLDTFKYGGAIFALTNIDKENWKNAKQTDITSGGEKLNSGVDLSKLSPETLKAIEDDLTKNK